MLPLAIKSGYLGGQLFPTIASARRQIEIIWSSYTGVPEYTTTTTKFILP